MSFRYITFCTLFFNTICIAQVELPNFFTNNMVLQQNDTVAIWGTDKPNISISIESGWGVYVTTMSDDNGNWKFKIKTPLASYTPYNLIVKGSNTTELKNVLIGEVWFSSGQSNMEMPLKGFSNSPISGYNEIILDSENEYISLFKAERSASLFPEKNVVGKWNKTNPSTIHNFSAIGYLFAKKNPETA